MHSLWKLTIKSLNFLAFIFVGKKFVILKWDLQTINFHDCFRYFCHQCFWRENCHWFEFSRQISKIHSIFWAIFKDCVFCCYVNASIFHAYFFIAFETEMGCRHNFEILGILSCFFFPNVFLECIKPRYFSYFIFMSACQNTLCFFSFSWKCFLKTQVSTLQTTTWIDEGNVPKRGWSISIKSWSSDLQRHQFECGSILRSFSMVCNFTIFQSGQNHEIFFSGFV